MTAFNHLHVAMNEEVEAENDQSVQARRRKAAADAARQVERESKRQQWRAAQ